MSDLPRIPDPTLAALGLARVLVAVGLPDTPMMAHRFVGIGDPPPCGDWESHRLVWAHHFAYIAVPCRECFPDAPKPGERPCTCLLGPPISRGVLHFHPDEDLSWQTEERT